MTQAPELKPCPSPETFQQMRRALEALLHRHIIYCGGEGLPFAGHTDERLFNIASAALKAAEGAQQDALAALERVKRQAKNEALEAAAKYHDNFLMTQTGIPVEKVVASTEAIRAMKEPEE